MRVPDAERNRLLALVSFQGNYLVVQGETWPLNHDLLEELDIFYVMDQASV